MRARRLSAELITVTSFGRKQKPAWISIDDVLVITFFITHYLLIVYFIFLLVVLIEHLYFCRIYIALSTPFITLILFNFVSVLIKFLIFLIVMISFKARGFSGSDYELFIVFRTYITQLSAQGSDCEVNFPFDRFNDFS